MEETLATIAASGLPLQGRLDAFKTEFETKFAHPVVLAVMHRATEELIALGQAQPAGVMTDSIQSLTQRSLARPRCGM